MIRGFVVDKADQIVDLAREAEVNALLNSWNNFYVSGYPDYFRPFV